MSLPQPSPGLTETQVHADPSSIHPSQHGGHTPFHCCRPALRPSARRSRHRPAVSHYITLQLSDKPQPEESNFPLSQGVSADSYLWSEVRLDWAPQPLERHCSSLQFPGVKCVWLPGPCQDRRTLLPTTAPGTNHSVMRCCSFPGSQT